jgi:hypothetical protein
MYPAIIEPIISAQTTEDYGCGVLGEMRIFKGNRSVQRIPIPVRFVHHEFYMIRPGLEFWPPKLETGDKHPGLWHCQH